MTRGSRRSRHQIEIAVAVLLVVITAAVAISLTTGVDRNRVASASSADVAASVGVNVHEDFVDTTYAPGGDTTATVSYLKRLGVSWIRTAIKRQPFAHAQTFLQAVHDAGIRVVGIVGSPQNNFGDYATGESPALIRALTAGVYKGRFDMLELPNEVDLTHSPTWMTSLQTFNAEYYRALKAEPATRNIPILGSSLGALDSCQYMGVLVGTQDLINVHPYTGVDMPEKATTVSSLGPCVASAAAALPQGRTQKVVASEFGWNNSPKDPHQGLPEAASAAYLTRALIWNYFHGVSMSFIYELFDQKPDPTFNDLQQHFGLVRVSGDPKKQSTWRQTAKPAFETVANLLHRLAVPPGQSPERNAISVQAVSQPKDVEVFRITRPDGSVDIAVWLKAVAESTDTSRFTLKVTEPVNATSYSPATDQSILIGEDTTEITVSASAEPQLIRLSRP